MKIIKEGQLPGKKVLKGTCSSCKTVFECTVEEAIWWKDPREGEWYEVKCPLSGCNRTVYVY